MTPTFKRVAWTACLSLWFGYLLYSWVASSECARQMKQGAQKHCSWNETLDFVRHGGSLTMWLAAIGFTIGGIAILIGQHTKAKK